MIRAVLDANVIVSGIVTQVSLGISCYVARRAFPPGSITGESRRDRRVLRYPKTARRHHWSEAEIRVFIESLEALAILTLGQLKLNVVAADPSDDRYLECAVEGDADCLVTGDRHLLDVGVYRQVEILTPREFLELLSVRR